MHHTIRSWMARTGFDENRSGVVRPSTTCEVEAEECGQLDIDPPPPPKVFEDASLTSDIRLLPTDPALLIFDHAENGDLKSVCSDLDRGVNVNIQCAEEGMTAIMYAIQGNHFSIVEQLVVWRGADVNILDNDGDAALAHAINGGNADIFRLLLSRGANITRTDSRGRTPLICCVQRERLPFVELLLAHGTNVNETADVNMSPQLRHLHKVEKAILCITFKRWTALMFAIYFNFLDIAKVLLQHGADQNIASSEGLLPFQLFSSSSSEWFIGSFVNFELYESSSLRKAVFENDVEEVRRLTAEADILSPQVRGDSTSKSKDSPFLLACLLNRVDVVRTMLCFDVTNEFETPKRNRHTALHICCSLGHVEILKMVLLSMKSRMIKAVKKGDLTAIETCLRRGVCIDVEVMKIFAPVLCRHSNVTVPKRYDGDNSLHLMLYESLIFY